MGYITRLILLGFWSASFALSSATCDFRFDPRCFIGTPDWNTRRIQGGLAFLTNLSLARRRRTRGFPSFRHAKVSDDEPRIRPRAWAAIAVFAHERALRQRLWSLATTCRIGGRSPRSYDASTARSSIFSS